MSSVSGPGQKRAAERLRQRRSGAEMRRNLRRVRRDERQRPLRRPALNGEDAVDGVGVERIGRQAVERVRWARPRRRRRITAAARPIAAGSGTGDRCDEQADGPASEMDLHVRGRRDVDAVDEPDPVRLVLHDHRAGADAVAEEADAAHQRAVGDAGRRKDDASPRREVLRRGRSS